MSSGNSGNENVSHTGEKSFYTFILLSVLLGGRQSRNFSHKTQPRPRKTFHSGSKANTDVCRDWLRPDSMSKKFPSKVFQLKVESSPKVKSCAIEVSIFDVFRFHFSL